MSVSVRPDGRAGDEMRPVSIALGVQPYAEGSALIQCGLTEVLCAVSLSEEIPAWLEGRGQGWLTAQYALLPRSTLTRNPRAGYDGPVRGRSQEIQRFIGRSLRAGLDLTALGQRLLRVDCDVIVADGGTRCAAITGAWTAVRSAVAGLLAAGELKVDPLRADVCAVSAGLVDGQPCLDLCALEDQRAEADFNLALTGPDEFIEIQGAAEKGAFPWPQVEMIRSLALKGAAVLWAAQKKALKAA